MTPDYQYIPISAASVLVFGDRNRFCYLYCNPWCWQPLKVHKVNGTRCFKRQEFFEWWEALNGQKVLVNVGYIKKRYGLNNEKFKYVFGHLKKYGSPKGKRYLLVEDVNKVLVEKGEQTL